jgi:outer membrane protein
VYLGVQGLMQLESAAKDAEAVALKREKDVMGQVAAGTEGEIASLRAQTETAQARGLLAQLAGQREGLLATLESLVGEPIEPGADVTGLADKGPAEETSEPWNAKYIVRSNKRGVASQETFVFYDRLMFLPTLMGIGKGSYNSNLGFVTSHFTYDLTLSLSIPLYDRGLRYSLLHEDEAKLEAARQKLASEQAGARAGWRTAKANLTAAQAALVQAEAQATLATKAQKQADGAFQVGLTTALELSDIDNKRFLAASQVAQVRAQLEVRKVEMIAAEGRLAQVIGLE